MLTCLRVRHLAIIDRLEVDLGSGLNVVTGETGAGKSILVLALQLVLGARARPDVVRTGCDRAEVEALFELSADAPTRAVLAEEGFEAEDDQLVLRRVIRASGGSRASVNGRLATVTQLRRIAAGLVDISSQHEHTTLVDATTHLTYLDAFGAHESVVERVAVAVASAREALRQLLEARERLVARAEREELVRFQISEFERLDPKPGEVASLQAERERLRHAEQLIRAVSRAAAALDGDEGAADRAATASAELERAARLDGELQALLQRVNEAVADLRDVAYDLGRYVHGLDLDGSRLEGIEERLVGLQRLLRRFGGDEEALHRFRAEAAAELAGLSGLEEEVEGLERARQAAIATASEHASELSGRRHAAASSLAAAITAQLQDLGMGQATVQVEVAPLDGATSELQVDGARLTEQGFDRAEFLIAPNPGESPRPLARVASGGELSRALLALKRVLVGVGPVALYVFDEVDTGVGGAVAEAIGRKIREVASHHQVLCITHQPQIAAFGDVHLHVRKGVDADGRTRTQVDHLDEGERREELARMLSGATLTDAAREAAGALLEQARDPR